MREPAISVQSLSKRYRLYRRRTQSLKELVLQRSRGEWEDLWALDDVSFEVDQGEFLGIVGPNGSGKSTLLKVLAGILRPDRGSVTVAGQVSALLELGAGFHPEYTGRENVYLYGTLLGLTRREVSRRYDAIVEFSELGGFMDYPVKNYSSGMYVRLGLSVAVQLDPEILLIDEVFAVGDASFQQRCLEHLYRLRGRGCTIVLVSHDTSAVRRFCERAVWIEHGGVVAIGSSDQVVNAYLESVADGGPPATDADGEREEAEPALALRDVELTDADGLAVGEVCSGAGIRVEVDYEAFRPLDDVNLTVTVFRDDGVRCLDAPLYGAAVPQGRGTLSLEFPSLDLQAGLYEVAVAVHEAGEGAPRELIARRRALAIADATSTGGGFWSRYRWTGAPEKVPELEGAWGEVPEER